MFTTLLFASFFGHAATCLDFRGDLEKYLRSKNPSAHWYNLTNGFYDPDKKIPKFKITDQNPNKPFSEDLVLRYLEGIQLWSEYVKRKNQWTVELADTVIQNDRPKGCKFQFVFNAVRVDQCVLKEIKKVCSSLEGFLPKPQIVSRDFCRQSQRTNQDEKTKHSEKYSEKNSDRYSIAELCNLGEKYFPQAEATGNSTPPIPSESSETEKGTI